MLIKQTVHLVISEDVEPFHVITVMAKIHSENITHNELPKKKEENEFHLADVLYVLCSGINITD